MLGAKETGKTTFLAALQIALLRQHGLGWTLAGDNPASTRAMRVFMDEMTRLHKFPDATIGALENYQWSLWGDVQGVKEWRWWGFRRRRRHVRVPLNLVDAPGEAANGVKLEGPLSVNFVESLARSAGIVLFFDPLGENERGDAFQHMYGVLTELRGKAAAGGRLPHYVAVCITKFDAIPVYRSAQALRIIDRDPAQEQGFPAVPEQYAQEFFRKLIRMSRSDDASLILPLLQQTFYEERIRFFATSAIGFYVDPQTGTFDRDDYQNHIPGKPDRIRGGVYPINVVEPVLWLGRNVARTAP